MSSVDLSFVIWYAIGVLAIWRTSSLFAREEGPFKMFVLLRVWIFTNSTKKFKNFFDTLNKGINCIWCNSMWFALAYSALLSKSIIEWLVIALSLSAFVIIVEEVVYGKSIN